MKETFFAYDSSVFCDLKFKIDLYVKISDRYILLFSKKNGIDAERLSKYMEKGLKTALCFKGLAT